MRWGFERSQLSHLEFWFWWFLFQKWNHLGGIALGTSIETTRPLCPFLDGSLGSEWCKSGSFSFFGFSVKTNRRATFHRGTTLLWLVQRWANVGCSLGYARGFDLSPAVSNVKLSRLGLTGKALEVKPKTWATRPLGGGLYHIDAPSWRLPEKVLNFTSCELGGRGKLCVCVLEACSIHENSPAKTVRAVGGSQARSSCGFLQRVSRKAQWGVQWGKRWWRLKNSWKRWGKITIDHPRPQWLHLPWLIGDLY